MIRLSKSPENADEDDDVARAQLFARQAQKREQERAIAATAATSAATVLEVTLSSRPRQKSEAPLPDACAVLFRVGDSCDNTADENSSVLNGNGRRLSSSSSSSSTRNRLSQKPIKKRDVLPNSHSRRSHSTDEFVDSFTPLELHQPGVNESMRLAPGVGMSQGGKSRATEQSGGEKKQLSRAEYLQGTITGDFQSKAISRCSGESGGHEPTSAVESSPSYPSPLTRLVSKARAATPEEERPASRCSGSNSAPSSQQAETRSVETQLAHAVQPQAPDLRHRWRQKFSTLGYQVSVRERGQTLGTQKYQSRSLRSIRAQPVLGATMGHGLHCGAAPSVDKRPGLADLLDDESYAALSTKHFGSLGPVTPTSAANAATSSAKTAGTGTVFANRELLCRLFEE